MDRVRPWTAMAAAPLSWRTLASSTTLTLPRSQPMRVFTVTGTSTASATARTIRPAKAGSFIRALPSPLLTIFGMGQPILRSRKSQPEWPRASWAASAMISGSLPKIWAPQRPWGVFFSRPMLFLSW